MSESPGYARSLPLVLLLAIIAACSSGDSSPTPHPGLGVYIPSIWTQVREVRGHRVHVVDRAVPCRSCHTLGDTEIGPVAFDRCGSCHAEEATIRHAPSQALAVLGKESPSDCTLCHRFTEGPSRGATETTPAGALLDAHAHEPQDCAHCHLVPQGKIPAVRVHETEACVDCHRPHQDAKPQAAPCAGCHTQISTSHALAGKAPNEVCTTCHQKQHARASEALGACLDCHREHEPKVPETALFAGGHLECVGCHRPHDFARAAATSCRGCHEGLLVLGGARVTERARTATLRTTRRGARSLLARTATVSSTPTIRRTERALAASAATIRTPPSNIGRPWRATAALAIRRRRATLRFTRA
jgi:hypothetical protein